MVRLSFYPILLCIAIVGVLSAQIESDKEQFEAVKIFPKNYYIRGDFIRAWVSKPSSQVYAYNASSKQTTFNAKTMKLPARNGFQIRASKILSQLKNIEVSYARVSFDHTWHTETPNQTDYSRWIEQPISRADYQSVSKIQDTELNFTTQLSPNFLISTGLTYLYLPDEIRINQLFPLGNVNLAYKVRTQNSLAGSITSLSFVFPPDAPIEFKTFLKTGFLINYAKQVSEASLAGDPSGGNLPGFPKSRASQTNFSFSAIAQGKVEMIGKINQWFRGYFGYNAFLVTGLAVASEQLVQRFLFPFPNGIGNTGLNENDNIINVRGKTFYQYLNLGLEFRW